MPRPSWEGYLRFNLISVPVKAYSANVSGGGKIGFHLIHRDCNSRIKYKKVCPIHGEVANDEIVSAYEFAKGQYVTIEPGELDKLRTENDKAIGIDTFIRPEALDPLYFTGRTYYLVPDGKVAQKPYAVFQQVMEAKKRYGIAQVVFSGRAQLSVVWPASGLLALSLLSYEEQVKKAAPFAEEVTPPSVPAEERHLAETLIETATADEFDAERYKDEYTSQLVKLLEAKAKGKKIVAARSTEEPAVINLMDALRQSLKRARGGASANGARSHRGGKHTLARAAKPARHGARRKSA